MQKYSKDEQLYLEIKKGNQKVIEETYKKYRTNFKAFIIKSFDSTSNQALEVYQEAFVSFIGNIQNEKLALPLRCTLKTYLFGIGKNNYHNQFSNAYHKKMTFPEEFPELSVNPYGVSQLEAEDNAKQVERLLDMLDEGCKKLLSLLFLKGYSGEAAALVLNIPSPEATRKRKYDCLKKIRKNLNR